MVLIGLESNNESNKLTTNQIDKLLSFISIMQDWNNNARENGILFLEDYIDKFDLGQSLKYGIYLVIDGYDPDAIGIILSNLVHNYKDNYFEYLKRYIFYQGALFIVNGYNTRLLGDVLLSALGDEYLFDNDIIIGKHNIIRDEY